MKGKLESLFDAVTETEELGVDLRKAKIILENVAETTENYAKRNKAFEQTVEATYILIFTNIAYDYVSKVIKKMDNISDFMYKEL